MGREDIDHGAQERLVALVREGFGPRQLVDMDTVVILAKDAYALGRLDGTREVATTCGLMPIKDEATLAYLINLLRIEKSKLENAHPQIAIVPASQLSAAKGLRARDYVDTEAREETDLPKIDWLLERLESVAMPKLR